MISKLVRMNWRLLSSLKSHVKMERKSSLFRSREAKLLTSMSSLSFNVSASVAFKIVSMRITLSRPNFKRRIAVLMQRSYKSSWKN